MFKEARVYVHFLDVQKSLVNTDKSDTLQLWFLNVNVVFTIIMINQVFDLNLKEEIYNSHWIFTESGVLYRFVCMK